MHQQLATLVFVALTLCSGSWARAQQTCEFSEFDRLQDAIEELDVERATFEPGSDERLLLTERALRLRRDLLACVQGWLEWETLDDTSRSQAEDARLLLVQNIVRLSVELGDCGAAADAETLATEMSESESQPVREAGEAILDDVSRCKEGIAQPYALMRRPIDMERVTGISLVVLSAGAVTAAVLSGLRANDRGSNLNELERTCIETLTCDYRRMNILEEERDASTGAAIAWGATSAALAGVGTWLWVRSGRERATVDAAWLPGGGMVRVRIRLGARDALR